MKKIAALGALVTTLAWGAPSDDAQQAFSRGDYARVIEILAPLAEAGDVDALGNLGNMYGFGQGVPKDLAKAESLWRRAAEKGLGTAMGNIGSLYLAGQGGLPQSDVLAAEWYTKAAEHRHTPSMLTLSSMYMNGAGVPRDPVRGLTWAGLAAGNAADPRIRQMADAQMRRIASLLTREEIIAADRLSKDLGRRIDANVARYRAQ